MSAAPVSQPIRVLLVDDSPIIRLGLRSALEDYPDIVIVGEAGSAADGVAAVAKYKPDVVLQMCICRTSRGCRPAANCSRCARRPKC